MLAALLPFTVAAVLIVLLPGPDSLVVVRGLVRGGRRGGVVTAAGVLCGLVVWVAAAALGISALLRASQVGYDVLRFAGAAYLLWLGVQSLRSLRRPAASTPAQAELGGRRGFGSGFWAGFVTDVLNPKVGVFFISFLPGFIPSGWSVGWTTAGLGGWYIALTALYFAGLIGVSGTIATWMATDRIRRRLDAMTGLVLVGFGIRLAAEA
ncbi:MAG: LysE family translocator [Jatrophihabitans sp.]|uniref:LysE family translocator n=1 Tax=Jatrophihabitans sp. TaxID=1932789 RepID=UPI003F803437